MSTSTSASLASIVSFPGRIRRWDKLEDNENLVKLHAKFWGKRMVQEEVSGQLTSVPGEREDDDTDESIEDDTKTGYVLVLDNKAIPNKRIWVRADYIRIYDFLVNRWQDNDDRQKYERQRAPSVVIIGQPGIGKSLWVYYALCRCLSEKRPVVWLYRLQLYMFVEDGVYDMGTEYLKADYNMFVWTLVDSDESQGVPASLIPLSTPFFIIYTTCPTETRWERMPHTTSNTVVVMNPWTRGEIHKAALLRRRHPSTDTINDTFDRFGPTPRLCIEAASVPRQLHDYGVRVDKALNQVTLERLQQLTTDTDSLTMDKMSHKLCLLRREDINDVESDFLISPITEHIQYEIANRILFCSLQRQIETFQSLYSNPSSKAMSGTVFENIFHLRFRQRIFIQFMPMVRSDKRRNLRWHASHCAIKPSVFDAEELEKKRQVALRHCVTLEVHHPSFFVYDRLAFALRQNVYYIPKKLNEAFTVFEEHRINDKLILRFEECTNVPPRDKWRFILIIPDDVEALECLYPKNQGLQKLNSFSSQVSVNDFANSVTRQELGFEEEEGGPHHQETES